MRFLVDECLSIDLVMVGQKAGHDAYHVAHVGKAGWWNVARHACEGDFVLVTNNASDFRRLYAAQPLHAGLVIIIPNVGRAIQRQLFLGALEELAVIGEPINQVLEVDLDGEDVTFVMTIKGPSSAAINRLFTLFRLLSPLDEPEEPRDRGSSASVLGRFGRPVPDPAKMPLCD
jgi:predicted nuclease of predicted toxin-antitoxin system